MKIISIIASILLIIGGLNWGIIGLTGYDVIDSLFASLPALERIIYILVGLSALWFIGMAIAGRCCCCCASCSSCSKDKSDRDARDLRDTRDTRDPSDIRDPRDSRDPRDPRNPR